MSRPPLAQPHLASPDPAKPAADAASYELRQAKHRVAQTHRDGKLIGAKGGGSSSPGRLSVANDADSLAVVTEEFIPRTDDFRQFYSSKGAYGETQIHAESESLDLLTAECGRTVALIALADPVRLQLVRRLAEGPCSVRRLAEGFPISRAAISQHLKVMLNLGLVDYRKHGPLNIYSLNPEPLQRLQSYLEDLTRTAVHSAEAWRLRSHWFERV